MNPNIERITTRRFGRRQYSEKQPKMCFIANDFDTHTTKQLSLFELQKVLRETLNTKQSVIYVGT